MTDFDFRAAIARRPGGATQAEVRRVRSATLYESDSSPSH